MPDRSRHHILLLDDEPAVRDSLALILESAGYDVSSAEDGFDGLLQLRRLMPEIIISDLNMPQMSGFEFLSAVRHRFPEIPVVAMSGAYDSGDRVPGGVIADAFYPKGQHHPSDLLRIVAELIRTAESKAINHHCQSAPVWIPRNGKDSKGVPFIVLTCTQCLRPFPLSVIQEDIQDIQETPCLFCATPVRYVIDVSLAVASPKRPRAEERSGLTGLRGLPARERA